VATSCVVTFGNVIAANLTVTGNFIISATNTQLSNSLSINNFGTATAIKVVQYEGGGPGHIHNVAEFWDYHNLAMVIDPEANVGIHVGASPGYALTVVDGVFIDALTLGTPLAISSGGTGVTTTTQNYVFAGPQFGSGAPDFRYLVNSDLPSIISVSNVSGNGSGLSSLVGSNVTGTVENATVALVVSQAAQPNITSVGLLTNLAVSNSLTTSNVSVTGNLNVQGTANILVANIANIYTTNIVGFIGSQWTTGIGNVYYVGNVGIGTSTVSANLTVVGNVYASNAMSTTNAYLTGALNVQGVSNLWNANVANVYALRYFGDGGLLSNITSFVQPVANLVVSNAVTTTNLVANTLTLANATASITGNLYVSNALSTTNAYLTGALNVQGVSNLWNANVANVYALRYFGDGGLLSNITSFVQPVANLVVSNAVTTTNLVANTLTLANATASITGNLYVSNALSTTNAYLTGALNVQGVSNLWNANVANVYALRYFGDGGLLSNITSFVQPVANLVVSNAVTTTNLVANTLTLANATASITGNLYVSNALSTTNAYLTGALNVQGVSNLWNANVANVYALRYFGDGGLLSNITSFVQPVANLVVSNAVTTTNLVANTLTLANATASITGNLYVSNALSTTNAYLTGALNVQGVSNIWAANVGNVYALRYFGDGGLLSNITSFVQPVANLVVSNAVTTTNLVANTMTLANATASITGNLYVSNALSTTNAYLTGALNVQGVSNLWNANVANVYALRYFGDGGLLSNITSFVQPVANLVVSNAVTTTNLVANTLTLANATASITGNIYVSNALQTTNVFATTINASTINVASISVPGSTPTPGYVLSTTGAGLSWIAAGGGGPSQWTTGTGNIYYTSSVGIGTSAVSAQLTVAGNIYYTDDVFKRGPYLVPSAANANAIQSWISSTCNNSSTTGGSSWWSRDPNPVYGNVAIGPKGSSDYSGSVLLPDGRVLFVPTNASNVGIYNPATLTFSAIVPVGMSGFAGQFRCGVLIPNGNVVFVPWNSSNIGMFNPLTYAYSNVAVGAQPATSCFQGAVLSPTGNVVMIPRNSANIGIFNPTTRALTNVGPIAGQSIGLFGSGVLLPNGNVVMSPLTSGGNIGVYNTASYVATGFTNVQTFIGTGNFETTVLAPNGNVIMPPSTASNALVYNPTLGTLSNIVVPGAGAGNYFQGGCLLPSGNIICCPADSANVGMIDPIARTYSNCAYVSPATGKFYGCTLIPNGRVVFTPTNAANVGVLNTFTPAPVEFCLAPYFNKV